MMWSLSLLKYARTGSVVSAVLVFLKAVCCLDSHAQTVSLFCSLLSGSVSSDKTGLNLFRVVYHAIETLKLLNRLWWFHTYYGFDLLRI